MLARARRAHHAVEERLLAATVLVVVRWTGSYGESGKAIGRVMRRFGRVAAGPPLNLYYDLEWKGPYDEIDRSYARVLAEVHERGLGMHAPSREVFLKGPGLLLRGDPRDYLTEIQIPVSTAG